MQHYKYTDVAREVMSYGKNAESITEAVRGTNPSAACAIGLYGFAQTIVDALTRSEMDRMRADTNRVMDEAKEHFLKDRQTAHGPCPGNVLLAIRESMFKDLGHQALFGRRRWIQYTLPEKGTEARVAYDRWMRRKPTKTS